MVNLKLIVVALKQTCSDTVNLTHTKHTLRVCLLCENISETRVHFNLLIRRYETLEVNHYDKEKMKN